MQNKKNLLITGANGFLGHHILDNLNTIAHNFNILKPKSSELDLLNFEQTNNYCKDNNINIILHLAAICGGIIKNSHNPGYFLYTNTQMALNVYESARINNIRYIYGLGTVCMYPKYCPVPFKEDFILGDFPPNVLTAGNYPESTNAPYSYGKRILLLMGKTYREQYGIGGAFFIPVNMMGEYDNFDLQNSHVIPALIRKFDYAKENNLPYIECFGTKNSGTSREFLYAGDCAEVIVKAICNSFDYDLPINLGTGKEIKIVDLANLISELVGYNGDITFNGKLDGQPRRCLDVSRAKKLLGWEAKIPLREALIKTISWYRANKS